MITSGQNNKIDISNTENNKEEANANKDVDYDELLSAAGEFGPYQMILFCSTFPFYIFGVFAYFSQLFMTEVSPNHWCWIPELENLTDIERRAIAIPLDPGSRFGYSQCSAYIANWSAVLESGQRPDETWSTQACQYGWEFNTSEIPYPTIGSEQGWVCDKNSYQATAQSIFSVGSIAGGFIVGWVADQFGRLPAATLSNMIGCVAGIVSIFSQNLLQFSLCRFLMGMSYDSCMMMTYLLVIEYVAPKYRSIITNLPFAIFYTLGATSLPWIALASGNWKTFSVVTSIPMALALLTPFVMPESPRWLLSQGRVDDAVNKVHIISKINKKQLSSKLLENFKISYLNKNKEDSSSFLEFLKRPILRKMFICICLEFMCCLAIFDALVRSIGGLGFDFFLSFTFVSFTEFPSLIIVSFSIDLTGRKGMSILALTVCFIFSIATIFVPSGFSSVMCAMVSRFAINMCVNVGIQWAAEMLPTPVRGSGTSIVHIFSYIGTIMSPYIVFLSNFITWLPLVLVGLIAIIGILLALSLPETAGKDMPQTFDEAEELVKNQKLFDIPFLRKNN